MMPPFDNHSSPKEQGEAHYGDLLYDLWRGKIFVMIGVIAGLLAAFFFMSAARPHYKAQMTVAPPDTQLALPIDYAADRNTRPDDINIMTTITEDSAPDFTRYLEMLRSITVSEMILEAYDDDVYDALIRAGRFAFHRPFERREDITAASFRDYLMRNIMIEPAGQTPMRRVSFQHPSAEFSQSMLQKLDENAQQIIRAELRARTAARIDSLKSEIEQTQNAQNRRALVSLLQAQEQSLALLNAQNMQSAVFIEAPFVSSRPVWPRGVFVYPVCLFVSVFLFFGLYLSIRAFRDARRQYRSMKNASADA